MNTLTQFLTTAKSSNRFQIFSNSWLGFLGYLMKRNTGYGQRKILNLTSEIIELACIAWVMDISILKSLILIPIAHICINYIQEYHWQLYRYAPKSWFQKKLNPLDLALWILSSLIYGAVAVSIFKGQTIDPVVAILFGIRTSSVLLQIGLAPYTAKFTSLRRVRPNVRLIWTSSIFIWILCLALKGASLDIYYAIVVSALFNFLKFC